MKMPKAMKKAHIYAGKALITIISSFIMKMHGPITGAMTDGGGMIPCRN